MHTKFVDQLWYALPYKYIYMNVPIDRVHCRKIGYLHFQFKEEKKMFLSSARERTDEGETYTIVFVVSRGLVTKELGPFRDLIRSHKRIVYYYMYNVCACTVKIVFVYEVGVSDVFIFRRRQSSKPLLSVVVFLV